MSVASIYIDKAMNVWNHAGFQKYFRNTGWMFFGQFFNIISLVINIWIARYLGPENFGIISYIFAFVGIFGFLTNLGINDLLIKKLIKNPEKRDEFLGTAFGITACGSVLSFLLIVTLAFIMPEAFIIKWLIIVYAVTTLLSPINVISTYFQATVQAKKNSIAQIIMVVISSVFKIIIILSGKGIIWFILSFVLDYVVGTVLHIINYFKSGLSVFNWRFNKVIAKEFLSSSYLLIMAGMTGFLLMRIDQVMIKHFLDESAVGIYAAAVRIAEIWYFIPSIVIASIFPAIINSKETNQVTYENRVKKMYWFLFLSGLIISMIISLSSPLIIKMFFGQQYINSVLILQIYTWSNMGLFLMLGINKFFISENKLNLIFIYSLLAVVLNIILNIIMIPLVGLSGAAWATLISYSIGPIIFLISRKYAK